jgi:cell division protein FtsB
MQWLKRNLKQIAVGGLIVVIILLMAEFNNRMTELNRLTVQRDRAAAQITNLVQTQIFVQTQIAYATSEAAVEQWAYEEGRLVRPGDNPVVPVPGGGEDSPGPVNITPINSEDYVENWQVWLALFFDRSPP